MSVPNDFPVVQQVYASVSYDLKTHDGQARFVDDAVVALHAKDARWGHLKKKPGQTNIHGHGEDSALYLSDTSGQSTAVDFIGGAGGPNPTIQWNPDQPRYSKSDWLDPQDHDGTTPVPAIPPQPPVVVPVVPGRQEALDEMNWLDNYYKAPEGLQRPDGLSLGGRPDFLGIAAWYLDVYQQQRIAGKSRTEARAEYVRQIRHSDEWKQKHPGETP